MSSFGAFRIHELRSWWNLPAHFSGCTGFLAFSSWNPVPACKALRSQPPAACQASSMKKERERELPLASFPDIGDSTAESDGGDSGESSLTRCCCFHLSPPVPQFPLTSPSTNTTTLSYQFPGSTWFQCRVPQALWRSAPQGWKKLSISQNSVDQ